MPEITVFPPQLWIIYAVSLVCCFMGFFRFVWFMSVGYGLSAAGIGAAMLVMSILGGRFNIVFAIQCILFIIYGFRLGGFLLIRELKNTRYREKMREVGGDAKVPAFVAFFMWIVCGALYVLQSSGPMYRMLNGAQNNVTLYIGIVVSAVGIIIETVADKQKGEAKEKNPDMPAMHGLYKMCRCPNYFGEILFWTGAFISAFGAVEGAQWILVVLGYVEIICVMLSGAKRVETRHIRHYGKLPKYNAYADSTPLLLPLIPFYHITTPEKIAKEDAAKAAKAAKKNGQQG